MVVAMAVAMVDWNYESNDQGLREKESSHRNRERMSSKWSVLHKSWWGVVKRTRNTQVYLLGCCDGCCDG